jgi:shikimate dehydrogenase
VITGATRLTGVIGWPVAHSRSPRMHNAAFAALGLDWVYVPLTVPPERVADAVRGLPALGFTGANVTVPHKQAVLPYLDELTRTAAAVGAVNTILVRGDGSLLGDSTDGPGFLADLGEHGVHPRRALVIGAGGAARSIVNALAEAGASVTVAARSLEKAHALCETIADTRRDGYGQVSAHPFPHALRLLVGDTDLVVNATSLGLHDADDLPWDASVPFSAGQAVYDLIYHRRTPFLDLAAAQGATTIDGLGMLVYQGALSFNLWTGLEPPLEVMRAAIVAT